MEKFILYSSLISIGLSGAFIVLGLYFIVKRRDRKRHHNLMVWASLLALLFVLLYLLRSFLFPRHQYLGAFRGLYLFLVWSHTLTATINFPLAVITLRRAFKGDFEKHKKVAPYTASVWIYTALTGWLIYLFQILS